MSYKFAKAGCKLIVCLINIFVCLSGFKYPIIYIFVLVKITHLTSQWRFHNPLLCLLMCQTFLGLLPRYHKATKLVPAVSFIAIYVSKSPNVELTKLVLITDQTEVEEVYLTSSRHTHARVRNLQVSCSFLSHFPRRHL